MKISMCDFRYCKSWKVNWSTAENYTDFDDWNLKEGGHKQRKHPVMGIYKDIVDAWLMEDACLPKNKGIIYQSTYHKWFYEKRREALVLEEVQAY